MSCAARNLSCHRWSKIAIPYIDTGKRDDMPPTFDQYCNDKNIAGAFENQILYKMCRDYPRHECAYITAGKVTAIGRIYAASPARGAGESVPGTIPLVDAIGNWLVESELDNKLCEYDFAWRIPNDQSLEKVIKDHEYLVEGIVTATNNWPAKKRHRDWNARRHVSFASKYLHFHRPNAYPIMDSFAKAGLNCVGQRGAFTTYKSFCEAFMKHAQEHSGDWTPRGIDTELVRRGRMHKDGDSTVCECCGHVKKTKNSKGKSKNTAKPPA